MNLFETVKTNVTMEQAAEFYGLEVKNGMTACIFHNDRNPSMKLYDDHFHCFGCGKHGDIIDLTARLFNLSPLEAAKQLAQDFGIYYDNPRDYNPRKDSILARIKREQDKERENHVYCVLRDYYYLLQAWLKEYAPKAPEEVFHPLFLTALNETDYIDNMLDCFVRGSKEEKAQVLKEENGRIAKIENTLRNFSRKDLETEIS